MQEPDNNGPGPAAFWERMAASYPLPFDEESLSKAQQVFDRVESHGLTLDGATILDIGCGTGVHSLPLARRATRVVGLDRSQAMLACFEKERIAHAIGNASTLNIAWKDADIVGLKLEKHFDIAWASMTPAVRDAEDLAKMRRCARHWCVYIGWGGVRKNTLLEDVFRGHGLSFGPPPGAATIRKLLAEQGVTPTTDTLSTHWDWEGSAEEAQIHATGFLQAAGHVAQPAVVAEAIARHSVDGRVHHRTLAEMGVLVWCED